MTAFDDRVAQVRELLARTGGWNARTRAALVSWARVEGVGEAELARILEVVLAIRSHHAAPPASTPEPPLPRAAPPRTRWIATALVVIGLALSIALLRLLVERIGAMPQRVKTPTQVAVRETVAAPERTLPPPPVSFPTPPTLAPIASGTTTSQVEPLGARPEGDLSAADLQAWRQAFVLLAGSWISLPLERRDAVLESLAVWMALATSPEELAAMRASADRIASEGADAREDILARALSAMLEAQVLRRDRLSPAVAGDRAFSSGLPQDVDAALDAWAAAQIPSLVTDLAQPQARDRWTGWLEAVRQIERPSARVELALAAIDGLLRSQARLDSQGLAADAMGSLVRSLPSGPDQSDFERVSARMIGWLQDASVPSERLWALGGVWRSVATPPQERLLVGERDSMSTRAQLAQQWEALGTSGARPAWQPLLESLRTPLPSADAPLSRRLDALSDRIVLLRRVDALLARRDPAQVTPVAAPEVATLRDVEQEDESRWADKLLAPRTEVRMQALQSLRAEGAGALSSSDSAALALRALSAPSKEERQLAQQVIRDSMIDAPSMRLAIAREVAVAADPRHALDLLQDIGGYDLPTEDVPSLRAEALASILSSLPPGEALESVAGSLARLDAEFALWLNAGAAPATEAGAAAWRAARRAVSASGSLRPMPPLDAVVQGASARVRRLERLAPNGPRAFAGALAVIADLEAARLSVQQPRTLEAVQGLLATLSRARARAADAIVQAGLSLDAIASLRLATLGAPLDAGAAPRSTDPDPRSGAAALALAESLGARPGTDAQGLFEALRQAVTADPSLAVSAALLLGQDSGDPALRELWLERAQALGAAIDPATGMSRSATLAMAQLLAAAERRQLDRVVAPKPGAVGREELERFARSQGVSLEALLMALRTATDPSRLSRIDSLRELVLHGLRTSARPWLGSLASGRATPMPEADEAQPARLLPQLEP
jgi:hypothetical protein